MEEGPGDGAAQGELHRVGGREEPARVTATSTWDQIPSPICGWPERHPLSHGGAHRLLVD